MNKYNLLVSASLLIIVSGGIFQLLGFRNIAGISLFGIASLGYLLYKAHMNTVHQQSASRKQLEEIYSLVEGLHGTLRWYGTQLLDYGNSTFKRVKAINNGSAGPLVNIEQNKVAEQTFLEPQTYSEPQTYFSPLFVEPSRILEKPSAHVAGRLAAEQKNSGDSSQVISKLVEGKVVSLRRKLLFVGFTQMADQLKDLGEIYPVVSGRELGMVDKDVAYFVIDEKATEIGPWSGVLDTQGTAKFSGLYESVKAAKANGSVIVVIASAVPGHYTGMLRQAADVVIDDGIANLQWASDIGLPLIQRIESLVQERIQNV